MAPMEWLCLFADDNNDTPLTFDTGNTAYFIDELGAGLAVVSIIVAYVFWKRRGELVQR